MNEWRMNLSPWIRRCTLVFLAICSTGLSLYFCIWMKWLPLDSLFESGFFGPLVLIGGLFLATGMPILLLDRRIFSCFDVVEHKG